MLHFLSSDISSQKILIFIHPASQCKLTYVADSQKQSSGTTNVLCDGWVNRPQLTGMKTLSQPCPDNILCFLLYFDIICINHNANIRPDMH